MPENGVLVGKFLENEDTFCQQITLKVSRRSICEAAHTRETDYDKVVGLVHVEV